MPAGPRLRFNNIYGLTTDNPLTMGATSFNSIGLTLLPDISSAHSIIVFDPKRVFGEPEIAIITAHTAGNTAATITRGAYGTSARSHPMNTAWAHVAIDEDYTEIVTSGTRPSDPYEGQHIYEIDTHRPVHRDNTQWLPGGPVSIVTSGSRPVNPYAGQTIFETDTDKIVARNAANGSWVDAVPLGAWQTWTPTLTQSGSVTVTNQRSMYTKIGRLVVANFKLLVTGSGSAGTRIEITIPVTAASGSDAPSIGSGVIFDSSANAHYTIIWRSVSTSLIAGINDGSTTGSWGATPNVGLAVNDQIGGTLMYEAAS